MSRRLLITIGGGPQTCRDPVKDEWCPWVRQGNYGTRWMCGLFEMSHLSEDVPGGWLQRLPECHKAEDDLYEAALASRELPRNAITAFPEDITRGKRK